MSFDLSKLSSILTGGGGSHADPTAVIGVDIGSSAIKVVQLRAHKGKAVLDTYGELQLGPYDSLDIGRTTRLRVDRLIEAFVDILREASTTASRVALAISYNATFTSVITLNTDDPEKVQQMLGVEARKYIPVPLADVSIDWVPIKILQDVKTTKGLLVAIHNEALARYESLLKGANLPAVLREIELFSTLRTVISSDNPVFAVLDLGAGSTKVYLVEKGIVQKSHSLQMSGAELTNIIATSLGVDFRTAEEQKRFHGLGLIEGKPELEKALSDTLNRGFREVHTVIRRYEEESGIQIPKVVLSGGGALLKGLTTYVQDALSLPTELARPFSHVTYPAFLEDTLIDAGPSFAVALGVALRSVQSEF